MVVGGGVDSLTEWKGDGFILISDFKKKHATLGLGHIHLFIRRGIMKNSVNKQYLL